MQKFHSNTLKRFLTDCNSFYCLYTILQTIQQATSTQHTHFCHFPSNHRREHAQALPSTRAVLTAHRCCGRRRSPRRCGVSDGGKAEASSRSRRTQHSSDCLLLWTPSQISSWRCTHASRQKSTILRMKKVPPFFPLTITSMPLKIELNFLIHKIQCFDLNHFFR